MSEAARSTPTPSTPSRGQARIGPPQDPAEGGTNGNTEENDIPRAHTEDPAEGPDDESATS